METVHPLLALHHFLGVEYNILLAVGPGNIGTGDDLVEYISHIGKAELIGYLKDAHRCRYLYPVARVEIVDHGSSAQIFEYGLQQLLFEDGDEIVAAHSADNAAVSDNILNALEEAEHYQISRAPADLLIDQRKMLQIEVHRIISVKAAAFGKPVQIPDIAPQIAVAVVVGKGILLRRRGHPAPADIDRHGLDQHPYAPHLFLSPGLRALCYVNAADDNVHHRVDQPLVYGNDTVPAAVVGDQLIALAERFQLGVGIGGRDDLFDTQQLADIPDERLQLFKIYCVLRVELHYQSFKQPVKIH